MYVITYSTVHFSSSVNFADILHSGELSFVITTSFFINARNFLFLKYTTRKYAKFSDAVKIITPDTISLSV